jgi:hypothetical protein
MIHRSTQTAESPVFRVMVAHELTHALDDQIVGLDSLIARRERTEDAEFVLGSLIEGSATALMTRYMARPSVTQRLVADPGSFAEVEAARTRPLLEGPPYFLTLLARYPCGMYFLTRDDPTNIFNRDGGAEVGENLLVAAGDLPRSSEQILHPRKYWDPVHRDDPVTASDRDADSLAARFGWRVVHRNTAGEALMAVLTRPPGAFDLMASGTPASWTTEAARGWGGDRFYLLAGAGADTASRGIWVTAWDAPEDRDEFVDAYEPRHPASLSRRVDLGPLVSVYLFGMSPEEAASLEEALRRSPLRLARAGAPWGS